MEYLPLPGKQSHLEVVCKQGRKWTYVKHLTSLGREILTAEIRLHSKSVPLTKKKTVMRCLQPSLPHDFRGSSAHILLLGHSASSEVTKYHPLYISVILHVTVP